MTRFNPGPWLVGITIGALLTVAFLSFAAATPARAQEQCFTPEYTAGYGASIGLHLAYEEELTGSDGRQYLGQLYQQDANTFIAVYYAKDAAGNWCYTHEHFMSLEGVLKMIEEGRDVKFRNHDARYDSVLSDVVAATVFSCQTPTAAKTFGEAKGFVLAWSGVFEDGKHVQQLWQMDDDSFLLVDFRPNVNGNGVMCYSDESRLSLAAVLSLMDDGYAIKVQTFGNEGSGGNPRELLVNSPATLH